MKAQELLDSGQLAKAIEQAGADLRSRPTDREARAFLFELLCYVGEWDRAGRQLDALEQEEKAPSPGNVLGRSLYRALLQAERERAAVFAEGTRPRFVLEPPASIAAQIEGLGHLRAGNPGNARAAFERAAEHSASIKGTAGDVAFEGFRNLDDRLAPVLEVFAPGGYFWIPLEHLQFLEVPKPKSFLDMLWAPAKVATHDGQLGEVHIPMLYPGTSRSGDDQIRLGRSTDWVDLGEGVMAGVGQVMVIYGETDATLFELGHVQLEHPHPESPSEKPTA